MRKIVLFTVITLSAAFVISGRACAESKGYLLPKFAFNFPARGGDMSFGLGGNMGYWIKPYVAAEIGYMRFLGAGDAPDNNLIEFNGVYNQSFGKFHGIIILGSGIYRITRVDLDSGWTGHLSAGFGLALDFIPTLNLRLLFIYYSLFRHKDLFSGQIGFALNF
jgi:hypothetical protein